MSALPAGWASATVGEIATLTDGPFGSNLKTSHYVEAGPRVVRLQNIGDGVFHDERAHITRDHFEQLAKHHVVPGDVVVASLGDNPPRACLVPAWLGDALVKADCIRVRSREGVESAFLMWMLNSPPIRAQASMRIKGVGRPRLGLGGIRQLEVRLPPLNEQRRIVAAIEEHLSRLDAADTSLAAALRRLDGLKSVSLTSVVNGSWPVKPLGEIARTTSGGTPSRRRPDYYDGGIPWVKSGELGDGRVSTTEETITELGLAESSAKIFPRGTLLIALYGATVGKLGLLEIDAATNQAVCAITPNESVAVQYLWHVLRQKRPELVAAGQGGAQPNISQAIVRRVLVPVPPLEEQKRIVAEVEERLSLIDALRASIERAERRSRALRAAILERAFRGELVPQDPADEPADTLLARIRAERDVSRPATGRRRKSVRP